MLDTRNMNDFESFWYEISPYMYLVISAIVLFEANSTIGRLSGLLLMTVAIIILRMRWMHRNPEKQKMARPLHRAAQLPKVSPKRTLRHHKN